MSCPAIVRVVVPSGPVVVRVVTPGPPGTSSSGGNTDLTYDPATREIDSSTGSGATLPLAGSLAGGTPVPGLQTAADAARVAQLGEDDSPQFAGLTVAGTATAAQFDGNLTGAVSAHCRNVSGVSLTALTPLFVSGSQGDTTILEVTAARSDTPSLMPAAGLALAAMGTSGSAAAGHLVTGGVIAGVNTAGLTSGASLFVAATGGLTLTRPTSGLVQPVAVVGRVHATTGTVVVQPGSALSAAAFTGVYDDLSGLPGQISQAEAEAGTGTAFRLWSAQRWRQAVAAWWGSITGATGRSLAAAASPAAARQTLEMGSAALAASSDFASAAQGTLAATAVQPAALTTALQGKIDSSDARLTDSREWSAETVTLADAEAGVSTVRRAFTVLRVWQAIAAWWQSISGATGRSLAAAATPAAARTILQLGTAAQAASTDFEGAGAITAHLAAVTHLAGDLGNLTDYILGLSNLLLPRTAGTYFQYLSLNAATNGGTGAAASPQTGGIASSSALPTMSRLDTGTTTSGGAGLVHHVSTTWSGSTGKLSLQAIKRFQTTIWFATPTALSGGANTYRIFFGWLDPTTYSTRNSIGVLINGSALTITSTVSGVESSTALATVVANTNYKVTLIYDATTATITANVNGGAYTTHSIPSTPVALGMLGTFIVKESGTTSITFYTSGPQFHAWLSC